MGNCWGVGAPRPHPPRQFSTGRVSGVECDLVHNPKLPTLDRLLQVLRSLPEILQRNWALARSSSCFHSFQADRQSPSRSKNRRVSFRNPAPTSLKWREKLIRTMEEGRSMEMSTSAEWIHLRLISDVINYKPAGFPLKRVQFTVGSSFSEL